MSSPLESPIKQSSYALQYCIALMYIKLLLYSLALAIGLNIDKPYRSATMIPYEAPNINRYIYDTKETSWWGILEGTYISCGCMMDNYWVKHSFPQSLVV